MRRVVPLLATVILLLAASAVTAMAATETPSGSALTGSVWLDLDGDGTRDETEPGRAEVPVTLRTSATIVDAAITSADGSWRLRNVRPGDYELVVAAPSGHVVTGGTLEGLDQNAMPLTVTEEDEAVGAIGVGSPATSGPDVAATMERGEVDGASEAWVTTVHNLGRAATEGPIEARIVLSDGHEATGVEAGPWSCEQAPAIVLCEAAGPLPAGSSLPPIVVITTPTGDTGATLTATATTRLAGTVDEAPLNDEAVATATVSAAVATAELGGDVEGVDDELPETGAAITGVLIAAVLALVVGATVLRTNRRS